MYINIFAITTLIVMLLEETSHVKLQIKVKIKFRMAFEVRESQAET